MPRCLNKVLLVGRVGREPELRYSDEGQPVTVFSIVVERAMESAGADTSVTDWFHVVAVGELARSCRGELIEGSWAYVEGRLRSRSWLDDDETRVEELEIAATDVVALDVTERPK